MKCTITIDMDNAAFDGRELAEIAACLKRLVKRIENNTAFYGCSISDTNGNKVGKFEVTED